MNAPDHKEERLTLEVLSAIERGSALSQRRLANQMGVALGLANSYVKRCVRKGYVRISEAPANRYVYHLTPKGSSEKSRLAAEYLNSSFRFYRLAAKSCAEIFRQCKTDGISKVVLCGYSELSEIALLQAMDAGIRVEGLLDEGFSRDRFFSKPVWRSVADLPSHARVLTRFSSPLDLYQELISADPDLPVLFPDVLGVSLTS